MPFEPMGRSYRGRCPTGRFQPRIEFTPSVLRTRSSSTSLQRPHSLTSQVVQCRCLGFVFSDEAISLPRLPQDDIEPGQNWRSSRPRNYLNSTAWNLALPIYFWCVLSEVVERPVFFWVYCWSVNLRPYWTNTACQKTAHRDASQVGQHGSSWGHSWSQMILVEATLPN